MTNTKYRPDIAEPKPWVPPMEARPKNCTTYRITVSSGIKGKQISNTGLQKEQPSTSTPGSYWPALTMTQLMLLYPVTTDELLSDLYITPSSSDSTICQDELTDPR